MAAHSSNERRQAGIPPELTQDGAVTEAYEGFHRVQDGMRRLRLLLKAKVLLDQKPAARTPTQVTIEAPGDELTVESLDDAFSKLVQLQSKMKSLQAFVKANKLNK